MPKINPSTINKHCLYIWLKTLCRNHSKECSRSYGPRHRPASGSGRRGAVTVAPVAVWATQVNNGRVGRNQLWSFGRRPRSVRFSKRLFRCSGNILQRQFRRDVFFGSNRDSGFLRSRNLGRLSGFGCQSADSLGEVAVSLGLCSELKAADLWCRFVHCSAGTLPILCGSKNPVKPVVVVEVVV
ncbi:predicted protein [Clavispora lusitaniae ATCC 42720]|uniref:Uncharacterized protein n=1 Tax=Clavispora lusitaniae (strain ATCC 42720) TaxID=306902 RepID=C4Y852_CLAL4|nr:uncharacterized protein CLUG_04380 [Clavispora lusitaniae ATCC 42720]EEQ40252.1 predicted protein [Clavispora lusitaniae ATCC 42720]